MRACDIVGVNGEKKGKKKKRKKKKRRRKEGTSE